MKNEDVAHYEQLAVMDLRAAVVDLIECGWGPELIEDAVMEASEDLAVKKEKLLRNNGEEE